MTEQKIRALQNYLKKQNADWLLLASLGHEVNDSVLTYVLTIDPEYAFLLIPASGEAILFVTPFEVTETQARFPSFIVRPLNQTITALVEAEVDPTETILVRESVFPVSLHTILQKSKLRPATQLETVYTIKNSEEINAMRAVTAKTDELFESLITHWSDFKTEQDAARHVYQFALSADCEVSFPPIIASGPHASEPHHHTSNTSLLPGFCVLDIGLRLNGYCSDLSRTVYLGIPTEDDKNLYQRVKEAQAAATALILPGIPASQLDLVCRQKLGDSEPYFIHGLGHGVGTAVHEWPSISKTSQAILSENMIITIEPGVYYPGKLGIRIEDDILVTNSGPEILNQVSKELLLLPI